MSLGTKAIRSCIEHNSPSSFRNIDSGLFNEEEQVVHASVQSFVNAHHQMPTIETLIAEGHALPRTAPEPPAYYRTQLQKRFLFDHITENLPDFKSAMEDRRLNDAVDKLRTMLAGSNAILNPGSFNTLEDLVEDVVADYIEARDEPGLRGVTLGYSHLDDLTLGAQGGDLIVVAGRTGMGKSWTLVKMAYEAARLGHNIGLVSMEMSLVPIARRWVGLHTGINPNLIRAGQLSSHAEQRLVQQAQEITEQSEHNNVYLLSGDFSKRVGQVERMIDEYEIDALYIDAAYLLTPEGQKKGFVTRWESIASVIQELKQIALRYNKPIILSVQMNRQVKKSTNRELDTSDIGGSDAIGQDASIIIGIRQGPPPYEKTRRVLDLVKNRDGEESSIQIHYQFNPVNLDAAPPVQEAGAVDLSWM